MKLPAALENAYVKSIRLGNTDVLNNGLHLAGAPREPLEIALGTRTGVVEGVGPTEGSIVLVPELRSRTDLYRSLAAGPSGGFRFEHVPPGNYKVFVWTDVENGAWFDSEFMKGFENRGTPVQVQEAATAQIRVNP
jgi:hypothetical protein